MPNLFYKIAYSLFVRLNDQMTSYWFIRQGANVQQLNNKQASISDG